MVVLINTFGDRLRKLRSSKKLKQEELGELINISKSAVGMYERNEREPSFKILEKIAGFFEVSIDYLLTGSAIKNNENLIFFDIEDLSEGEIEDIKRHITYVKWKSRQDNRND